MRTLIRKVFRDLTRRRLRNALTLFGILLGVTGVVAIAVTARNMADAQQLTYDSAYRADLAAFTGNISPSVGRLVERQPNVEAARTRTVFTTRFSAGAGWHAARLIGIADYSAQQLDVVELSRGRFPGPGEIAFDESALELVDLDIGTTVAVQRSVGVPISYLTVSGFTRSPATLGAGIANRAVAYTDADDLRAMTGHSADNYLLVRVHDQNLTGQTAGDIRSLLNRRGIATGDFLVRDAESFAGSRELATLLLMLRVFSVIGAVLAAFLVGNTLAAVLSEEAAQIGVMMAVGGRTGHIAATYLVYSSIIGIAGAVGGFALGTLAGRALSGYLTSLTGLQQPALATHPREVGLALGVGLAVTVAGALLPAMRSARLRVATLLRSPGVRAEYQARIVRWLHRQLGHLGQPVGTGVRNLLRKPARTGLTVLVVTVAVMAFVATQSLSASLSGTVDDLYRLYGADGWISFQRAAPAGLINDLESEPFVAEAEVWASAPAAIGSTRTDAWGVPVADPLYQYRLVEGAWLSHTNPVSIVITSNLASRIGARTGMALTLDVSGRAVPVRLAGIVDDSSTYLGNTGTGKVFMPVNDLSRLVGLGGQADFFALKFRSSEPADVDAGLAALEDRYRELLPGTLAAHEDKRSARQAIGVLTLLLRAMVLLVAVVGVAGIANTLIINITERRHELGILRAIGARDRQVVALLVVEGLTLALVGSLAGILLGIPLARYLVAITGERLFALDFHFSPTTLAGTVLVSLLAVAAVSALPGLAAARLRPAQVLRYE